MNDSNFYLASKKQHRQNRAIQQLPQQLLLVEKKQRILQHLIVKLSGINILSGGSVNCHLIDPQCQDFLTVDKGKRRFIIDTNYFLYT